MSRQALSTERAAPATGAYSQGARKGPVVVSAGQVGATPDGRPGRGIEEQTRLALENVRAVLAAAGATLDDVISVRVFLSELSDFAAMNAVYEAFFSAPYPARTTVGAGLPGDIQVEIDALAVVANA